MNQGKNKFDKVTEFNILKKPTASLSSYIEIPRYLNHVGNINNNDNKVKWFLILQKPSYTK